MTRAIELVLDSFGIVDGAYGYAREVSSGKDTPSGHWEIAGVPVRSHWGYFLEKQHSFPRELLEALVREAGLPGVLGDCHASGTEIIARLGDEDLLILTADHGCDPTWFGTDHTREHVPVLALGAGLAPGSLGGRATFADIGQSLATLFDLPPMADGESFLPTSTGTASSGGH